MTLLLTDQGATAEPGDGCIQARTLDFSLPVPHDSGQRVRALSYLNETIDRYVREFCRPCDLEDRQLKADLTAEVAAARKADYRAVRPYLAAQIFLCFSICLLI